MMVLYKLLTMIIFFGSFPFLYIAYLAGSQKWSNRLGFKHNLSGKNIAIWLHAASVGEIAVLDILIKKLKKTNENLSLYLTVVTETGYKKACSLFGSESVGYLPLDCPPALGRFFSRVKPTHGIIVETEIWPQLICMAKKNNICLSLINGRLSERSTKKYARFKPLLRTVFACYRHIIVQSESDLNRFITLGARPDIITVMGNLKFDAPPIIVSDERRHQLRSMLPFDSSNKILIFGSIRNDEYDIMVPAIKSILNQAPEIGIIIAPRYVEKITELTTLIKDNGKTYKLFTDSESNNQSVNNAPIFIINKMGFLNEFYSLSDLAVVGGTFDNMGGHNILEPVWAGIPVMYGPSIDSVRESAEYIEKNNYGLMVFNTEMLTENIIKYFRGELSFNRKDFNDAEPSRTDRTISLIMDAK